MGGFNFSGPLSSTFLWRLQNFPMQVDYFLLRSDAKLRGAVYAQGQFLDVTWG